MTIPIQRRVLASPIQFYRYLELERLLLNQPQLLQAMIALPLFHQMLHVQWLQHRKQLHKLPRALPLHKLLQMPLHNKLPLKLLHNKLLHNKLLHKLLPHELQQNKQHSKQHKINGLNKLLHNKQHKLLPMPPLHLLHSKLQHKLQHKLPLQKQLHKQPHKQPHKLPLQKQLHKLLLIKLLQKLLLKLQHKPPLSQLHN